MVRTKIPTDLLFTDVESGERTRQVLLRLTDAEKEVLQELARKRKMRLVSYLRHLIAEDRIRAAAARD